MTVRVGVLAALMLCVWGLCADAQTDPSFHYFKLHERVAADIERELEKRGYGGIRLEPGLYYQDQLSIRSQRFGNQVVPALEVTVTLSGGGSFQTHFGKPGQASAVSEVAVLPSGGRFSIGFVNSELGQRGARPWILGLGGKLRYRLSAKNHIWKDYPKKFQVVKNGVLVTQKSGELVFVGKNGRGVPLGWSALSRIETSDFSDDGFYFVGARGGAGAASLIYATTGGEVYPIMRLSRAGLIAHTIVVPEGFYVLDNNRLDFVRFNRRTKKKEVVFTRRSTQHKRIFILDGSVVAKNRLGNGQEVSYFVAPDGSEIEAKVVDHRKRLRSSDKQILEEFHVSNLSERSAKGVRLDVVHRPRYTNSILGKFVFGRTGWVNLTGQRGVNVGDVVYDFVNSLTWSQKERLPRNWRGMQVISVSFEELKAKYEAGLAVERDNKKTKKNSPNPWREFMKTLTGKRIVLAFPDFLRPQGAVGGAEQLGMILQMFNTRVNGRDLGDIEAKRILILTATEKELWDDKVKGNPSLDLLAQTVIVQPVRGSELRATLYQIVSDIESRANVRFDERLIQRVEEYSANFYPEMAEPERSARLLRTLASFARTNGRFSRGMRSITLTLKHLEAFVREQHGVNLEIPARDVLVRRLNEMVIGQDLPLQKLAMALARIRSGLYSKKLGYGTFLLIGPKGVGKTHTVRALAEITQFPIVDINLAAHPGTLIPPAKVAELKRLENVPHIVLLDEIDKASPEVINGLHPILERGAYLADTFDGAKEISFRKAMVLATANYGSQEIEQAFKKLGAVTEANEEVYVDALEQSGITRRDHEKPDQGKISEFVWVRIVNNLCIFTPPTQAEGLGIIRLSLRRLEKRLKADWDRELNIRLSEEFAQDVVGKALRQRRYGHGIKRALDIRVINKVSEYLDSLSDSEADTVRDIYVVATESGRTQVFSNVDDAETLREVKRVRFLR